MFVYQDGLPIDYIPDMDYGPMINETVKTEMMRWVRSAPGQIRVRLGKADRMRGQEVNLKRMENE